jgi:S-adenosylmethionine:tRNA ribosyltransferase-isomerase
VFNDTQVVKARLFGTKPSGGRLELLIERVLPDGTVAAHMKVSKKPPPGTVLNMDGGFAAELLGRWPDAGGPLFHLRLSGDAYADGRARPRAAAALHRARRHRRGPARYQTVFAKNPGAVAAPAALHFDDTVLAALEPAAWRAPPSRCTWAPAPSSRSRPKPGRAQDAPRVVPRAAGHAGRHRRLPRARRARGGRGHDHAAHAGSWAHSGQADGDTGIFITPGFRFPGGRCPGHQLPPARSTLMMLVSAFAGHAHVMALYRHAVAARYRFFSYGDAMWLVRPG